MRNGSPPVCISIVVIRVQCARGRQDQSSNSDFLGISQGNFETDTLRPCGSIESLRHEKIINRPAN